ncbi:hypothetical protein EV143_1143 [Flavobacterium chryseum]|uniref:hypothetical protein n=1 Tax=Flavobacterium sp. P3160 TaxID=2512113 RepID=UPI00105E783C|nr:hypothetical protein [Flavobacterium sp. P3160]TDO69766.1 hypothetical protein EV143_1143 [Flavobacterium sp. P3160]
MKLNQSKIEIQKAENSLMLMKESKTMIDFENNWRDFLISIEKAWIKSERECVDFRNKFQPWQGKFVKTRKNDPLLKYLKNARDVDTHSIEEIINKISGSLKLDALDWKKNLLIDKIEIVDGKITKYEGSQPLVVVEKPPTIQAKAFTNQGIIYLPPTFHIGKNIKESKNPIELAELGLKFYSNYLQLIEDTF